ncbi:hypothetical protein GQ457_01G014020 [Hibiscus cannabinus]
MILCDLCIKEILIGNRLGTHFKREGWVKIVNNFEKETGKPYTQKQLKNKWDLLKKEWNLWKKLKEKDIGLGWNPIKRTVDAFDDWWESRLKVVPEAQRFRFACIDPELEDKLNQMFKGIVATGNKAWAPSSGIMPTDFIEHGYNETLEEIEEENEVEVVPMLRHSILKNEKKKSSKQIGGAAKLSLQIDKLCNTAESMSNATSRLNPITDPFGIPKAYKVMNMSSDDEREINEISQQQESYNKLFIVTTSSIRLYYEKYLLKQPCMDSKQSGDAWIREILNGHESRCMINFRMSRTVFKSLLSILETRYNLQSSKGISSHEMLGIFLYILGIGASVSQCRERFQRSGWTISQHFTIMLEKLSQMAMDIIAPDDCSFSSIPEQIRNDSRYMPHFKDCICAIDGTHIPTILPPNEQIPYIGRKRCSNSECYGGKYYLVDSGYPQMKGYLRPYRGQRYHLPDFRKGRPMSGKEEIFNHSHSSLRSVIERTFGVLKKKWAILRDMPSYSFEKQRMIVICTMTIHNFIRKHAGQDDANFMEYDRAYENINSEEVQDEESYDDGGDELNVSSGYKLEFMRDVIACGLMNSI